MRRRVLLAAMALTGMLFHCGCSDEKIPFEIDKEQVKGTAIPVTVENLAGTWRIHRLYSEYHDMTVSSPTLRSGYVRLSADSAAFCQNAVTNMPVYEGTASYDSLDRNVIFMNMHNVLDPTSEMPEVRLEVTKLTETQMAATWIHYDPNYGTPEDAELLMEYTFENGSLAPTVYKDGLVATDFSFTSNLTVTPVADSSRIEVTGWTNNFSQQKTRNLNFRLTSEDYVIAVDSLSFVGFRTHNTNPAGNSKVNFLTSPDGTSGSFQANGAAWVLAQNNDRVVEDITIALTRPVMGNDLLFGLACNITNNATLYILGIRVYGKFTRGEKFYYEYIFNKE